MFTTKIRNNNVVIHHINELSVGGTTKIIQTLLPYFLKDKKYKHYVSYKKWIDISRESDFISVIGEERMLPYNTEHDFLEIVKHLKPHIIQRYSAGIPEFPFVEQVKEHTNHFVSLSTFGEQDETIDISAVIYVSLHVQFFMGKQKEKNHYTVRVPVIDKPQNKNLRKELGIEDDIYVFGRIGRSDDNIYDPINIKAYSMIETDKTCFISVNSSQKMLQDIKQFNIKNFVDIPQNIDYIYISKFYNTIDVLAHARKDGECCPTNIAESFSHSKPVISHYGDRFNGQIENIQNAGFTVLHNDIKEYARIMKNFVDKKYDYEKLSKNARQRYEEDYNPEMIYRKYIEIYNSL